MLPPSYHYSAAPLSNMNFQPTPEIPSNKYMYVKQGFLNGIQQSGQSKVLINPNFMQAAHVKPHFNKQFLVNQTIHVNPNVLKRNNLQMEQRVVKPEIKPSVKLVPNKAIVTTPMKLIRVPQGKTSNSIIRVPHTKTSNAIIRVPQGKSSIDIMRVPQVKPSNANNVIVSTRTKLVRVTKGQTENGRVRRTSIHTKYKIIRHPSATEHEQKRETHIKKLYYVKNRFAIDHRSPIKPLLSQKLIRSTLLYKRNTLTTKNVYVKCNSKLNKTQYVSINGILYRRSPKSLITMNKKTKTNKVNVRKKEQLLTIRGQKYKLDSNHRTLTLLSRTDDKLKPNFKTIYVGGVTFKQKEPNVFVKTNTTLKQILLSQAKQRSINTLTNKMKKSNIPCPFYRKFGKCKGKENGTCIRIHNPDQVSLCPKFLQGACINDKCLLSHKVSAEKMPTCKFFLEGLCSKEDCPYLHVKINAKAEICKDFVEGFCRKAAECDKRHQYLCPDFEKNGNCTKRKCPYPHGNMASIKFGKMTSKNHPVRSKNNKSNSAAGQVNLNAPEAEKASNLRYYDKSKPSTTKQVSDVPKECGEIEIVDLDLEQNDFSLVSPYKKRPTVGDLPSFIPFLEEDKKL